MSKVSPGNSCLHFDNLYSMFCLLFLLFTMTTILESVLSTYCVHLLCDRSRNTVLNK